MNGLTLERMRADIAEMLGDDDIGLDDSLIDLGLDSIRAMMLVETWKTSGVTLDFAELAEGPTLGRWWTIARRQQAQT